MIFILPTVMMCFCYKPAVECRTAVFDAYMSFSKLCFAVEIGDSLYQKVHIDDEIVLGF